MWQRRTRIMEYNNCTNGNHTLTASARDAAGNTATSTSVIVTVSNDTQSPTVSITAPAAGNVSGTINVTANASDNIGVAGVQFLLDGVNWCRRCGMRHTRYHGIQQQQPMATII